MKILQVIQFFTPGRGGSVAVPYYLSKYLADRNHEITILTTDFEFDKEYANSLEQKSINVIAFHSIVDVKLFSYSPSMKKWLNNNVKNFDVIHLHNFRSYQNKIVHYYAKKYGVPYILQAHGDIPVTIEKHSLKKLFDLVWGKKILFDATKVVALNETEKEDYKKMDVDEDKIEIIPNGIDLSEYNNLPENGRFRKKFGIKDEEKIFLYLGRIHQIKGIDLLINTFADLTKKLDDLRLVIVGQDDGYLATVMKQIDDLNIGNRVLVTGPLYGNNKLEAYVDADVYVLPSRYETFPLTVLEACACGVPVIVTNKCGIADSVEKFGYVVEYDKSQLTDAILDLLGRDEIQLGLGEKGKKLMKDEFNWDKIVKKFENVYINLM